MYLLFYFHVSIKQPLRNSLLLTVWAEFAKPIHKGVKTKTFEWWYHSDYHYRISSTGLQLEIQP